MDNKYDEMAKTIRDTTERIISEGPESCLRFLLDAGIISEGNDDDADREKELMQMMRSEFESYKDVEREKLDNAYDVITDLRIELAQAQQKIKELQEWHDSHL